MKSIGYAATFYSGALRYSVAMGLVLGCGAVDNSVVAEESLGQDVALGTVEEALITWKDLSLQTGWSKVGSVKPSVANINGVITFRGAIKGNASAGSSVFTLTGTEFAPVSGANSLPKNVDFRVTLSGNNGGVIGLKYGNGTLSATVNQDGAGDVGTAARALISLDGVSYDKTANGGTELAVAPDWAGVYGYRTPTNDHLAPTVKLVGSFVRFQGKIIVDDPAHLEPDPTYLFTLPANVGLIPSNPVRVPISLGASDSGSNSAPGFLSINSNGKVYFGGALGQNTVGYGGLSLESTSFAIGAGGSTFTLEPGWVQAGARSVKVRNDGGVIRFQGAIQGGTTTKIGKLTSALTPTETIYVLADSWSGTQSQLIINTSGDVSVHSSALSAASPYLSLDGVSFALR
jgi:hypothetical protein